jgi:MoxR-like ATPase
MQESRVTIDGVSYPIEPPFLVMATQNPIESEGTYNLPEAQLDRFLFKLVVEYPSAGEEAEILKLHTRGLGPDRGVAEQLDVVSSAAEVRAMQRKAELVLADDHVLSYIASLVRTTRRWPTFSLGASPRAGVAILRGARGVAALEGRDYVLPDDVQEVVLPALRHRVILTPEAEVEGRSPDELLAELVRSVEVPLR